MNCRSADFIGYSIFLEIFLEMRFLIAFGVPEKSVFTRLFCVFATAMLANFQDRLVMTASEHSSQGEITLRKYDATYFSCAFEQFLQSFALVLIYFSRFFTCCQVKRENSRCNQKLSAKNLFCAVRFFIISV
jgi:hypothetical protein